MDEAHMQDAGALQVPQGLMWKLSWLLGIYYKFLKAGCYPQFQAKGKSSLFVKWMAVDSTNIFQKSVENRIKTRVQGLALCDIVGKVLPAPYPWTFFRKVYIISFRNIKGK